jgi:hypothetical protein
MVMFGGIIIFLLICAFIKWLLVGDLDADPFQEKPAPTGKQESWFIQAYPFIDLYTYYALLGNKAWTPEKVRLIKNKFAEEIFSAFINQEESK